MHWIKHFARLLFCTAIAAAAATQIVRADEPAPVLLDFYSEWCGPCRAMQPTVDALIAAGYPVERIDIDARPDLARRYAVGSIPCFVVVERGREIDRITGTTTVERLALKLKAEGRKRTPGASLSSRPSPLFPHSAWRYERSTGHRAALVRVYCEVDARTRSIGSGTLVRWGNRIVVLTARHVVKDAKSVVVEFFNKRTCKARVVKVDATWDCAVLEIAAPDDVAPAEIELGEDAMQHEGDRLESCGYGADGKLACNSGLFLGYKRSTQAAQGPDDWMEISGQARGGDSGGGVFNANGRLVGVLWGTDGRSVVCVQAGRIHALLDDAFEQQSIVDRSPTPPRFGPLVPVPPPCADSRVASESTRLTTKPVLPWRGEAENRDNAQAEQLDKLIELERLRAARQSQPPSVAPPAPEIRSPPTDDQDPSPLLAGLCIAAGVAVGFVVYFGTQKS